jgi:hypothetical protein
MKIDISNYEDVNWPRKRSKYYSQIKDATQPFLHYFLTPLKNHLKDPCTLWLTSSYSRPPKQPLEGAPFIKTEKHTIEIQKAVHACHFSPKPLLFNKNHSAKHNKNLMKTSFNLHTAAQYIVTLKQIVVPFQSLLHNKRKQSNDPY